MDGLIQQAFKGIKVISPEVQRGNFDLLGPDDEIILPQIWESVIQPGWQIKMMMWPPPNGFSRQPQDSNKGPSPEKHDGSGKAPKVHDDFGPRAGSGLRDVDGPLDKLPSQHGISWLEDIDESREELEKSESEWERKLEGNRETSKDMQTVEALRTLDGELLRTLSKHVDSQRSTSTRRSASVLASENRSPPEIMHGGQAKTPDEGAGREDPRHPRGKVVDGHQRSRIPRLVHKKESKVGTPTKASRVSPLAKQFEHLSGEFEEQRVQDRKLKKRADKMQRLPLNSSPDNPRSNSEGDDFSHQPRYSDIAPSPKGYDIPAGSLLRPQDDIFTPSSSDQDSPAPRRAVREGHHHHRHKRSDSRNYAVIDSAAASQVDDSIDLAALRNSLREAKAEAEAKDRQLLKRDQEYRELYSFHEANTRRNEVLSDNVELLRQEKAALMKRRSNPEGDAGGDRSHGLI